MRSDDFIFRKVPVPGKTGYQLECECKREIDGELMLVTAAEHLYEGDYEKEIPEEEKTKLRNLIIKKYGSRTTK